jgi:hypothetical protein
VRVSDMDNDADLDGLALELYLAMSKNPPRSAVRAVWSAIADGKASSDSKDQWLEHIAKYVHRELLENYDPDDRNRGYKALRALGLYGKVDGKYADDRSFVEDLYLFADAEGRDIKITPAFIMQCRYPDFQGTKKERRNLHKRLGEIIKEAREDTNYTKARLAKQMNAPDTI